MNGNLYVGNLPATTTSADLIHLFGLYGTVRSVELISDPATGQSKGYGYVQMDNDLGAEAAIAALNGSDYHGQALNVYEAQPQVDRQDGPRRGGFGDRSGGGSGGRVQRTRNET